jgi:hypothetical protein
MPQDGALSPEDLDFLQQIYEAAAATATSIDDRAVQNVVTRLIACYQGGERDRVRLMAMAARDLHRAAG